MTTVQMGVVVLRIAARLLGTVRSPHAKKVKGKALLKKATARSQGSKCRGGSLFPPSNSTAHIRAAPRLQRNRATQNGGNTAPAMRIMRNDTPQTAESNRICNHDRAFMP